MNPIRIGINGFGRIGRIAARIILNRPHLQLAAINSRSDASSHAYLLKYDSTYGTLEKNVLAQDDVLVIEEQTVKTFQYDKPEEIPWNETAVHIVIDASGKFRTIDQLNGHLKNGVSRVVLSAPAKDDMKTIVLGVNQTSFDLETDKIISNSSCTTNCLATTLEVLHDAYVLKRAFMTTTHAMTDSQNLLDNSHKKEVRLRRSAISSMIPASTGSAKDVVKLFPDLTGKIVCEAVRVPLATVSLLTLIAEVEKEITAEAINESFKKAAQNALKGILDVATDELVSKDYTGNPHSSIVDPFLTRVLVGNLVSISAWYDNEWGYASRLVDLVEYIGNASLRGMK